jgi:hypothetical protein
MNANRTLNTLSRVHTFFVILGCAVLGFTSRAEASPFMLNLVSSGSSGGGGGHVTTTGNADSASRLGLNVGGVTGQLSSSGGSRMKDGSTIPPTTILSTPPSLTFDAPESTVATLTAAVKTSVASLTASGSFAQLELGNGETLSVSGSVVDSLVSSVSSGPSATSGGTGNPIEPSQPNTDGVGIHNTPGGQGDLPGTSPVPQRTPLASQATPSDASSVGVTSQIDAVINGGSPVRLETAVPDEIVQAAFADVVAGIISAPAGATNLSPGGVAGDDLVHAPEPATLLLLASGLLFTTHQLRRRRTSERGFRASKT